MAPTAPPSLSAVHDATSFVFGGHIGPQSKNSLAKQVRQIVQGPNGEWILDTIAGLPKYWDMMAEKMPEVGSSMEGPRLLAEIESWFRNGPESATMLATDAEIPDLWIGILMVAIQLDQYWRYVESRFAGTEIEDMQAELVRQQQQRQQTGSNKVETVGFCAGMIAAVAVASSQNVQEFQKYGAVAIRVAALMAALVGATEEWTKKAGKGGSISMAVAWRTPKQGDDMNRIVSKLNPDAYVSVLFDASRATVTASERIAPKVIRQLRAAGVTAIPLAFKGQLHSPTEERARFTEALIEICHNVPELQFPDAAKHAVPTYLDRADGNQVSGDETDLMAMVMRSILANKLNWSSTVSKLASNKKDISIIAFGLDRPLPPTILRTFGNNQVHFEDVEEAVNGSIVRKPQPAKVPAPTPAAIPTPTPVSVSTPAPASAPVAIPAPAKVQASAAAESVEVSIPATIPEQDLEDVIAIVGMSIKTAGGKDLEEFEAMLKTGESQHQVISRERMTHDMLFRTNADEERTWYGNFMDDPDAFDHKFFKKSPRESMAIDPQGRQSLEAAYQTLEQAGYFREMATTSPYEHERRKHVGVYVGLCSYEYDVNIHCHPTSAFTGTGELRSFIPGRVSHFFGWTGPSLTFDTACSSSTTALHWACRDLLSGEVPAALCGGVNVLTNMQWSQNLAAGSFISPTGQCKPFDASADGYCRGDGIAYVFLKKLSTAIKDGNNILGTVRATGINQNLNSTPLFVPNVPSLTNLFNGVLKKARVTPKDIGLVECHGTGTPVGDPAEWQSMRNAVAGSKRDTILPVGSAKGHVGHTEGASGLVSLIKILLMMRGNFIPPQASHKSMNPNIHADPSDNMEVVTALRSWPGDRKNALLNNYGACGSNASVVISHQAHHQSASTLANASAKLPFYISGLDARSIAAYASILAPYLSKNSQATLADVSFNMNWRSNPDLAQAMIFSASSLEELQSKLATAATATKENASSVGIAPSKGERPVILCFGGQVSTFIGLDRTVYETSAVLRKHLDECDAAITAQGLESIYPAIFSTEPIQNVVQLQTALFAMQYSSARAWIDSGLNDKVVSLVGHSFGEITALCVSGVLSLADTVKLIAGRARLIQTNWGPDSGGMMAIEADESLVHDLIKQANATSDGTAGIACYNGPRSFTVAGSTKAVDAFATVVAGVQGIKSKRLNVTNAFHSALVENLVAGLNEVGKSVTFKDAVIPMERATEETTEASIDWQFVATHMRQPVFFNHAVHRLAQKYPEAVFLEAGSNSTITVMASRALSGVVSPETVHFQAVSITNVKNGLDKLTDATIDLWKQGLRVSFWPQLRAQKDEYAQLLLPPYQFEKTRHWLELKSPVEQALKVAQELGFAGPSLPAPGQQGQVDPKNLNMWTFLGYQQPQKKKTGKLARFRINTESDKYQRLFSTHLIAKTAPIAPATLEIDIAIETLFSLNPEWKANGFSPVTRDLLSHSPICADPSREYYIDLEPINKAETEWSWIMHSIGSSPADEKHAEGRITMVSPNDPVALQEFARWERVVSHAQCQQVLALGANDEGVEALAGRNVYRAFEDVVVFGECYQGVKYLVGRDNGDSAGVVHKRHGGDTWLDVPRADTYGQVAGMYVNLLTDIPASDMFVATGLELVMRNPKTQTLTDGHANGSAVWHVLGRHSRINEKSYVTDVFIFDAATSALAEVILGLRYVRIPKSTMSKILARVTTDKSFVKGSLAAPAPAAARAVPTFTAPVVAAPAASLAIPARPKAKRTHSTKSKASSAARDVASEVRDVVANVSGMEAAEISLDSQMADIGIDSLMAMELAREIENHFRCTLDSNETMVATSLREFVTCVENALVRGGSAGHVEDDDDNKSDDGSYDMAELESDDDDSGSDITTPDDISDFSHEGQDSKPETSVPAAKVLNRGDVKAREAAALRLVETYTSGWETAALLAAEKSDAIASSRKEGAVVIVTGASGSLGSHIVQSLAERSDVANVVCVNRAISDVPAGKRQEELFTSRGIKLSPSALQKLRCYGTDTSKPLLGLPEEDYTWLVQNGTHIIHNAWPMSATRPLKAFESQIQVVRNLLDLARDMATGTSPRRIGFQFISSIGVTGFSNVSNIIEQPMSMAAVMPSGYNEGKWTVERMIGETLRQHPRLFRAMTARPGQISGSTSSGYWNPVEHFAFIIKSCHGLKSLPDLGGVAHWLPVDKSARVMVDLLNIDCNEEKTESSEVYHVDNPVGQPWKELIGVLAKALEIPSKDIVPFDEWIRRVKSSPLGPKENPAAMALGFLEDHFQRMATGGIVLDTAQSSKHSETMAAEGPVSAEIVKSYVRSWKAMGFLS